MGFCENGGRRMNDSMGEYIVSEVVKLMIQNDIEVKGASVLVLGVTFKENCTDVRNTKVVDVVTALKEYKTSVTVYDPWANPQDVEKEYGFVSTQQLPVATFDTIVLTVAHEAFKTMDIQSLRKKNSVVYDVKNILSSGLKNKNL